MTEWNQHPFLDPNSQHTYDGMPPVAFENPNDYRHEHEWFAANDTLQRQLAEDMEGQAPRSGQPIELIQSVGNLASYTEPLVRPALRTDREIAQLIASKLVEQGSRYNYHLKRLRTYTSKHLFRTTEHYEAEHVLSGWHLSSRGAYKGDYAPLLLLSDGTFVSFTRMVVRGQAAEALSLRSNETLIEGQPRIHNPSSEGAPDIAFWESAGESGGLTRNELIYVPDSPHIS